LAKIHGGSPAERGIVAYGDSVVIFTFDGRYVTVPADRGGVLFAVEQKYGEWDRFEIASACTEDLALSGRPVRYGDPVGLKLVTSHGIRTDVYVGANLAQDGDTMLTARVPRLQRWEVFRVMPTSRGDLASNEVAYGKSFCLMASNDRYVALRRHDDRALWAQATKVDAWERFMFVEPMIKG
jgi:hypothetical protein